MMALSLMLIIRLSLPFFRWWRDKRRQEVYMWRATKTHSHHVWVPVGLLAKGHMKCKWTKPDDNLIEKRVKVVAVDPMVSITYETLTGARLTRSYWGFIRNHIPYD